MLDEECGSRAALLLLLPLTALAAGCSNLMNVQIIRYDAGPLTRWEPKQSPPAEKWELCGARLVEDASSIPKGCEPVGDVYIGDNGDSFDCGRERVTRDVEAGICRLRADVGVIRWLSDPVSQCHQARAVAYQCPAATDAGGGS